MKRYLSLLPVFLLLTLLGNLQAQHRVFGCNYVGGTMTFYYPVMEVKPGGNFITGGTVNFMKVTSLVNNGGFSDQYTGECLADYSDLCEGPVPQLATGGFLSIFGDSVAYTTISGSTAVRMKDVQLSRHIQLDNEWQITGSLTWNTGRITTDRSDLTHFLHFLNGSSIIAEGDTMRVNGYAAWSGDGNFTLPTGSHTKTGRVGLAGSCGSLFKAAYFTGSPGSASLPVGAPFSTSSLGEGLYGVSALEYWDVDGADSTAITLHFDAASSLSTSLEDIVNLVVAGWDGTKWVSLGQASVTGALAGSGSVTSDSLIPNSYKAFTFGFYCPPPKASCQNVSVYLDEEGNGSLTVATVDSSSTATCGIDSMYLSLSNFDCDDISQALGKSDPGGLTTTLYVIDSVGFIDSCVAFVTVLDTLAPTAVCQAVSVSLDSTGTGSTTAAAVDNGSSDNCEINLSLNPTTFGINNTGANTVTLTVTDGSNNSSTCTATVTVEDKIPPVAKCQNLTLVLNSQGNRLTSAGAVNNNSTDASGISSLVLSQTSFNCANVGPNTVTLTVTDNHSNSSTCSATITILDNTPPQAQCKAASIALDAQGNGNLAASAVDNGSTDACGIGNLSLTPPVLTCAHVGAQTVTLTVTDPSGNTATCTAAVTVTDNTAPVAKCKPASVLLTAAGTGNLDADAVNDNSTDACGIGGLSLSQSSFSCAQLGPNTVTLTATDVNGNSSSCAATVTVLDQLQPNAKCKNATLYLDATGQAILAPALVNNSSSDNCGIESLSVSKTFFDCSNLGPNAVTLTVLDPSGNSKSCNATVMVADNLPPTLVCQNITLPVTGGTILQPSQVFNAAASVDNCGTQLTPVGVTPNLFYCADAGQRVVTLTVTDGHGNTASCQATVIVQGPLITAVTTPEDCGQLNGTMVITAQNFVGQPGYSVDAGDNYQLINTFSTLEAGIYPVVVTFFGADNCTTPPIYIEVGENILTNTWTGGGDASSWTDILNWSLTLKPTGCHHVVIPAGKTVFLAAGQTGDAHTLDVQQGGVLTVDPQAVLNVKQ
jgi:hypothetical protein